MTQQPIRAVPSPADGQAPPTLQWGPRPGMFVSPDLAAAFMLEVWKASPERFGNFMKKAMAELWHA